MGDIRKRILKKKNFIVFLLIASFLISVPYVGDFAFASSAEDKKKEAEEDLEEVESEIEEIEGKQEDLELELGDIRQRLSAHIDKLNQLRVEIENTKISIAETRVQLEIAQKEADDQYAAMLLRIRFMYENATMDNWIMHLLSAESLADLLNRAEYISSIYKADRELTEQYKGTVARVEAHERDLSAKMDMLLVSEEAFLGQQYEIEAMIASLEDAQDEYAEQLAEAKEQAEEYRKTIEEQNEIIKKEEEEKRKDPSYPGGQDVSGEELVQYALQFVGNPYVWGGNSLTNGCDCSGFVHLIYEHFGYNTVRYSMSFLNEGVPVDRADVRPGDIVVYNMHNGIGHVAIYIGNGKIVEAQSSAAGITANRSIDCRSIAGIRRILKR